MKTQLTALTLALAALVGCSDDEVKGRPPTDAGTGTDSTVKTDAQVTEDTGTGTEGGTAKGTADIQILSLSDWHGNIDPVSENDSNGVSQSYGGIGVLSAYFQKDREANPNTILFTSGDEVGATPSLSTLFKDEPAVKSMNFLKLAANTLGNHNFDNGTAPYKALLELAEYKSVSSNLTNVNAELGSKVITPFTIIDVGATEPKVKVGVIGITNPDAPTLTFPGRLGTIVVKEPVAAANQAAKDARAAGANVVVALVHMGGLTKDASGTAAGPLIEFAKGIEGIDVVLGDHTDFVVNTKIGDALVVENRSYGRTYAKMTIKVVNGVVTSKSDPVIVDPQYVQTAFLGKVDGGTTNIVCRDAGSDAGAPVACPDATFTCNKGLCQKTIMAPDPAAEAVIKPYRDKLTEEYDKKIGEVSALLVRDGSLERKEELPIGNLIADAILDKYKPIGAQIAIANGGGMRAPLPSSYLPTLKTLRRTTAGYASGPPYDLVVGDIYNVLPFGNLCVVRKVTGKTLWQVLEKSVAIYPATFGGFVQVAGFSFEWKESAPAQARVQKVTLTEGAKDIPKEDPTEYTLVLNDFQNAGGDGMTMLIEPQRSASREIMADILRDYIIAKSPITIASPWTPTRIIRLP